MELHCTDQRDLPHDLIAHNILTRLPIKPLVRFKSVSKLWYSTLSSPHFAQTHVKFPSTSTAESLLIQTDRNFQFLSCENGEVDLVNMEVDFDVGDENLVLVGSCNGLVCLGSTSGCLFIIWNPVTREFRKYSDSVILDFSTKGSMVLWGFGYVSAIDDYKIVRICKIAMIPSFRVHVFSIRFNTWRNIDNEISHNFPDLRFGERLRRPGTLVNETLSWMGSFMRDGLPRNFFAFDLALELIYTFPHLDVTTPSSWVEEDDGEYFDEFFDEFLCVVKGRLSKYGSFLTSGDGVITIQKHPGEIEQIFLSMDVVGRLSCNNLIGFTGNDNFFIQKYNFHSPRLGMIDPSLRPIKYIPLMTFEDTLRIEIISYSASLISPASITNLHRSSVPRIQATN